VNILIALIDPNHVGHDTAHEWFREMGAACLGQPATNGATVAGSPPNSGISGDRQRHAFWKDDLSLIGSDLVNVDQIMTPGQITDTYFLSLAVAGGAAHYRWR
jgi:hypothetical protein